MMKFRYFSYALALIAALLFSFPSARSDAPSTPDTTDDNAPLLQITPGGHICGIGELLWTHDGKQLIGIGDKVIRFWNTNGGEIVRALRGQIESGQQGRMYAAALSPDGKTLVVGGFGRINHW